MPVDEDTLQFYRRNAEAYAGWAKAPSTRLVGFLACCRQSFEGDARARLFSARHRWLTGNGRDCLAPRDSGHDTEW